MPNRNTFSIPPIAALLKRFIRRDMHGTDAFARDATWGTMTNDLNPKTAARFHIDALAFLRMMSQFRFDFHLFDPPYSARQIVECYEGIGRQVFQSDTQRGALFRQCRDAMDKSLKPGGIVISCGWDSNGMGLGRGYTTIEILMVRHGGAHHDTLVTVERKNGGNRCS
jgi:hypothetical protein